MFRHFINIFSVIRFDTQINFNLLVKKRMYILEKQGYDISSINWDLYERVLEAKFDKMKADKEININTPIFINF